MSRRLLLAVAFGACIVMSGCLQSTEPNQAGRTPASALPTGKSKPSPPVTTRAPHLATRVRSAAHDALSGSDVPLVLSVTNLENTAVTLHFGSGCQLLFEVRDANDTRVSESWFCAAFPTTMTLQPHETRESLESWMAAKYDYHLGVDVPLPAGRYEIRAYLARAEPYESPPLVLHLTTE